jgi:hypothetical protein
MLFVKQEENNAAIAFFFRQTFPHKHNNFIFAITNPKQKMPFV